jgi:hypothetical protein
VKNYCVYAHERASDGKVFYIGKGKPPRAYSKIGRSQRWLRTAQKHGLNVRYIKKEMPEPCAFSLEIALISAIGRDNLCNMTDGGEGTSGRKVTQSQRVKCSASNKGKKPAPHSISLAREKNSKPVATRCGLVFPSATAAAKAIRPQNWESAKVSICGCANGKTRRAYGYEWGFVINGSPLFRYQSKMSEPRPTRWRPVNCSNGMTFDAVGHAVDWLKSIGRSKASTGAICRAAKNSSSSYGFYWNYA